MSRNKILNLIPIIAVVILAAVLLARYLLPETPVAEAPITTTEEPQVIAIVNGEEMRSEDFAPYLGFWAWYNGFSLDEIDDDFATYFMEQYVGDMIQYQFYLQQDVYLDEDYLDSQVEGLLGNLFYDEEERAEAEATYGFDSNVIREVMRILMLSDNYVEQLRNDIVATYSEEELYDVYLEYQTSFTNEEEAVSASHILVGTEEEAQEVLDRLAAGSDFADLAADLNPDSTRYNGGYLGVFFHGDMVEEFEEAAFAMREPGEISGIVPTDYGFHIIQLHHFYEEGSVLDFDDARDYIPYLLAQELSSYLLDDLWSSADIVWSGE